MYSYAKVRPLTYI